MLGNNVEDKWTACHPAQEGHTIYIHFNTHLGKLFSLPLQRSHGYVHSTFHLSSSSCEFFHTVLLQQEVYLVSLVLACSLPRAVLHPTLNAYQVRFVFLGSVPTEPTDVVKLEKKD